MLAFAPQLAGETAAPPSQPRTSSDFQSQPESIGFEPMVFNDLSESGRL